MAAILAAVMAIAGCGGDSVDKSEVTLKVRSEGSPERRLMGQIYAQALRRSGYDMKVGRAPAFESTDSFDEVKAGKLAGYPEYLSTALFYEFGVEIEDIPSETPAAYSQAKRDFEKKGLVAFPPAPYSIENAIGMLKKTAERRGLRTISDLTKQKDKLTLKGPTYCHVSAECLGGIEDNYTGRAFEIISYERALTPELTWWRAEPDWRYEVLENGEAGASFLYNTDGRLARQKAKFVILEDGKHIFPASNFVWVTSPEIVDEAGPDYERAIVTAQKGLTLGTIRKLNAKMELGGKPPAQVAAEYLDSIGRVR
jgi:osmoprotectant transport system substrate-binding protein